MVIETEIDLRQSEREAFQYAEYSMLSHARMLTSLLINKKQLPHFYFTDAANQIGVSTQTCRQWKISTRPMTANMDDQQLRHITEILIKVHQRVYNYPQDETYYQAVKRLKARIKRLKSKGYTHNQIAGQARISHKTLSDIIRKNHQDSHRNRRCPWELLNRLKTAEQEIDFQKRARAEASHLYRKEKGEPLPALKPPAPEDKIQTGDPCLKCKMPWTHLYENGRDPWKNIIMTCRTCGRDNLLQEKRTEPLHELIERYSTCWNCYAPWHNMAKEGIDQWNNTVYTCRSCGADNRVPNTKRSIPKQKVGGLT